MIKRIRDSLTIKIFLLVFFLLLMASGITYAAVSRFLPVYYTNRLEEGIDRLSEELVETIGSFSGLEDAFPAVELFEAGSQVSVTIFDEEGNCVWPAILEQTAMEYEYEAAEDYEADAGVNTVTEDGTVVEDAISRYTAYSFVDYAEKEASAVQETAEAGMPGEAAAGGSAVKQYKLQVADKAYVMFVTGGMQPVNQAMEIMRQIFPYIVGIAVFAAVLSALAASFYLTAPVVRLSRISRKMAKLDFVWTYEGKRTDEIGILGESLNEMAANLSGTLEELQQANARLKSDIEREREQERKRIAFFSSVSHELKTPITILKGHLSGMLQGVGEYKNRVHYLQRSLETTEKMEAMVQELLTVSRMESRPLSVRRVDLAEQLRLQLAELTELMEAKDLELVPDIPEHLWTSANESLMEKVFRNLLTNAIRYTPAGAQNQIRIRLVQHERISFEIENTGVHIPEEALPHIFDAFYRVEQSRNRQMGGSGLGLYIVRMALEQHGAAGQYGAENTADGVRFYFSLAAEAQACLQNS